MFICGTGSFSDGGDDATPATKRSRRSASFCRILGKDSSGTNKNPYADRGLDKFYALLADLDDKKQKIYTRMGSEDISFVRFVYSNDEANHVKPIVVKVKERSREKAGNANFVKRLASNADNINNRGDEIAIADKEEISGREPDETKVRKKRYLLRCKGSFSLESFKQPYWYFLAIVVLIMALLMVFGKSFAILCTSIGWYLVPTVVGGDSASTSFAYSENESKPKRKKEYVKKLSENKMNVQSEGPSSPTSVINGLPDNRKIQKQHHGGHKKELLKLSSI